MNEQVLLWDDLRVILAVARSRSLSGAGRRLGVSHATVFRRLAAIETRLGVRLFDRAPNGYAPTVAGEDLALTAERVETLTLDAQGRIVGHDLRPSGTVRVTTTQSLLVGLMTPVFASFASAHPDITLEVVVSNEVFDLARREADVAIRLQTSPLESLVGRRLGTVAQAIYGADPSALPAEAHWIGGDERMNYRALEDWMTSHGHDERCRYRVDTVLGMLEAARCGIGLAVLPCYLADGDPRLCRIGARLPELAVDVWMLTHPHLRRTARIRAFVDHVASAFRRLSGRLDGTPG
ncbi:LysR family transcriptional regulator [Marinivivus vitaminiproducens]|uniref:LysR family transcriptional regulator n=1 Tax=Marinivivus vitaminiproducens TaxID=3035935 RepID=UPI0027AAC15B|nr:LysR family transcriptional regulator [Geminicoccaceae bacterium SCSIO 64248]